MEIEMDLEKELSTSEVAARLGVAPRVVRSWCARGDFPNAYEKQTERGPIWKIPAADLEGYVPRKVGRPRTRNVIMEKAA
ncbi:MAG: helix-turn-helix domain-containing protein [Acidobacteria bacterium]|nr:helix-turn-helix domain-containing protein [Acidobacteriota bacterium]